MEENSQVWTVDDEIPLHMRQHKRLYPNDIIDPDEPPAREKVKAIKFLMQSHLPGSFLGEWQYPLPSVEVFRPPIMFPAHLRVVGAAANGGVNSHSNGS